MPKISHKDRFDILLPLFLFFLVIITRIPFTSKLLYHMDSGHFALALEKYDITVHQPHPPGYFLYVMLGKLLNYFIRDANSTFVFISIVFSSLTIIVLYYLGREIYDKKTGILAAIFALTSPNLWFHGEVALSYVLEAFFSTAVAFLCWRIYKGEHNYIWLSVIALGIAGGIRQNTIVFLLPLWLFSVKGVPIRKIIGSLALMGLVCLLWFIPMVWMTGGWNAYREAFRELWLFNTGHISVFERGWESFKIFSSALLNFTFCSIGAGIYVLSLAAYSLIKHRRLKYLDRAKVYFFSFWVLPSVFFYLMVFNRPTNPGYVLIFLPALCILLVVSIGHLSSEFKNIIKKDIYIPVVTLVIVINLYVFFFSSNQASCREIKKHDYELSIILRNIKLHDPTKTVVFVQEPYTFYGFRQVMYYLPEFRIYQIDKAISSTGEVRKTFWGLNRKTFLSDEIILPKSTEYFIVLFLSDSRDEVMRIKNLSVKKLQPTDIYIALGHISLIKEMYPELKIRLQNNNKDNKYEL
ncbi:MAG: hypothetical protein A2Y66_02565 [Nitrospirae bacterium RBG_13_41_22]|nr:MAG: hypothetical protein A2Y66_02565 [Nitrospirae bacterium RBG_13_41_22]